MAPGEAIAGREEIPGICLGPAGQDEEGGGSCSLLHDVKASLPDLGGPPGGGAQRFRNDVHAVRGDTRIESQPAPP